MCSLHTAGVDKIVALFMVTVAAVIGAMAVVRALTPAVDEGADAIAAAGDGANGRFTQVMALSEMTTPDDHTVELWVKNVGSGEIAPVEGLSVALGSDMNPRPYRYGGAGCAAPCWEYDLGGLEAWSPGATLQVRLHLDVPVVASSWYRATVRGLSGGDATRLFRVRPGLAASTTTPVPMATATATPTP
jgi:hypothetical protein